MLESMNVKELLQEVHKLLAIKFHEELTKERDEFDEIPASVYTAIITFLKNNEITADIKDAGDLQSLREMLISEKGGGKGSDIVEIAERASSIMGFDEVLN